MSDVVFIDSRVTDYQILIDGLEPGTEYFLIDDQSDGLDQIVARLQGRTDIDALHIISHGSEGTLYLGSAVLGNDNLTEYRNQLELIGQSLTDTGDILLYGCNVGAGETGQDFITQIAQVTGADVAASINETGSWVRNGDWNLEVNTGVIESASISTDAMNGILSVNTVPSFYLGAGDGTVTTVIGTGNDWGYSVAVQSDGKILVAGATQGGSFNNSVLVRYDTVGGLDTTFSGDGKVTTAIGDSFTGYSVAVQSDGKILVAGGSSSNNNQQFTLVRYDEDGNLDTAFSGDGIVTTDFTANAPDYVQSIAVQTDGKILVVGVSNTSNGADFALVRYRTDGNLDTTFSGDGKVTTDIGTGSSDYARSVAIQADGKILVAGQDGTTNFALVRYNTDGSLDSTFSGDGKVITDIGTGTEIAYSIAVQSDGKILVAGESSNGSNSDFALVRYNTNGSLDSTFSGDGIVTTAIGTGGDIGYSVAVQADGKILVAGYGSDGSNYDFALVRYNTDGSLDTTFNSDGMVTTAIGASFDIGYSIAVQPDGKILVTGYSNNSSNNWDIALARYNSDGSLV